MYEPEKMYITGSIRQSRTMLKIADDGFCIHVMKPSVLSFISFAVLAKSRHDILLILSLHPLTIIYYHILPLSGHRPTQRSE